MASIRSTFIVFFMVCTLTMIVHATVETEMKSRTGIRTEEVRAIEDDPKIKSEDENVETKGWYTCDCDLGGCRQCYDTDGLSTAVIIIIIASILFFFIGIAVLLCYCCACCCFIGRQKRTQGQVFVVAPQPQQQSAYFYPATGPGVTTVYNQNYQPPPPAQGLYPQQSYQQAHAPGFYGNNGQQRFQKPGGNGNAQVQETAFSR